MQEALANVRKHARASDVSITILATRRELTVLIDDDGVGIATPAPDPGRGITSMRERARSIGGSLEIVKRIDARGTRVILRIPRQDEA